MKIIEFKKHKKEISYCSATWLSFQNLDLDELFDCWLVEYIGLHVNVI